MRAHAICKDASGDRIIFAIQEALRICNLKIVYFGVDFRKYGTSTKYKKNEGGNEAMNAQLDRITTQLESKGSTVLLFDADKDYPRAAAVGNAMAIAAAELTVMSRASYFMPLVRAGRFALTVQMENNQPILTENVEPRTRICRVEKKDSKLAYYISLNGIPFAGKDELFLAEG